MKKFLCIYTALSLIFSICIPFLNLNTQTQVVYAAEPDYNTLAPMLDADSNSDGEYTGSEVGSWFSGLAESAQETFSNTVGTFFDLCEGVAGTVEHGVETMGNFFSTVGDLPIFHVLDDVINVDVDALNTYNNVVLQNIYSDSSGMVCYVGPSTNVANFYAPTNTPNLPAQPTSYAGAAHRDGITWFSLYYESSKSPYLNNPSVALGVRDMRFMVYGGMYSNASNYYVTFVCYSYSGSQFNTYGNFKVWCTLDNFVGAPVFTSLAKGQAYYLGTSDMYGFPSVPSADLTVSPTVFHQNINEVSNSFYEEYKNNITNTDLNITDIDSLLKVAINTYFGTEHEIEPTELVDFVRAIYLMMRTQFKTQLTDAELEDISALIPDAATTYIVPSEISSQGSPSDFWSSLFSSRWAILLLLFPLGLAAAAYVIFGK